MSEPTPHHSEPAREAVADAADFLIDRLNDFESEISGDDAFREWAGHVSPAVARLTMALARSSASPAPAASGGLEAVRVRGLLSEDQPPAWAPLKKALWDVVTGERLNDGRYVNAYELTDKLYAAALAAPAATGGEACALNDLSMHIINAKHSEPAAAAVPLPRLIEWRDNFNALYYGPRPAWAPALAGSVGREDLAEKCARLADALEDQYGGIAVDDVKYGTFTTDSLLREVSAALSPSHPAPSETGASLGVKVKALEWDKPGARLSHDPDEAYEQVKAFTLPREIARTCDLQRYFQIGYNRAAGFIERMEDAGLISKWDTEIEGRYVIRAALEGRSDG